MSILYTVSFTTQKLIHKFDDKNKPIGEPTRLDTPITITALPYKTAMSYAKCDNFVKEVYVPDAKGIRTSHKRGIGNGVKSSNWNFDAANTDTGGGTGCGEKAKSIVKSAVQNAAETGDMAAAVNG